MVTPDRLSYAESEPFLRLFNRCGYVLDFSTTNFDRFTQDSVGILLCQHFNKSKGASLEEYASSAPRKQVLKLFSDLLSHYEISTILDDKGNEQYAALYSKCKESLAAMTGNQQEETTMYFNVIMRADKSQPMPPDRFFEGTDSPIAELFTKQDGTPDMEKLKKIPTITVKEFNQGDNTQAQIGYLGDNPSHQLDTVVAEFPASLLCSILPPIQYQTTRTKWIVLEGDPYRKLGSLNRGPLVGTQSRLAEDKHILKLLLSSPSDLNPEIKEAIFDCVRHWNYTRGYKEKIVFLPSSWEKESVSDFGNSPQEVLNNQLVDKADALIAVFTKRLGTPVDGFQSGTDEEIHRALEQKKPVAVFLDRQKSELPVGKDLKQYNMLEEYLTNLKKKCLCIEFSSPEECRNKITDWLDYQAKLLKAYCRCLTPT